MKDDYTDAQEKSGFHVGDRVIIFRKIKHADEGGWGNIWDSEMDATIGSVGVILSIGGISARSGIKVQVNSASFGYWWYPYFCLIKEDIFKDKADVETFTDLISI